jgi:hypothetical protein
MHPNEVDDILNGAEEIAKFLFGPSGTRRQVYQLSQCSRTPFFRVAGRLCAKRSVLLGWISAQENRTLFGGSIAIDLPVPEDA